MLAATAMLWKVGLLVALLACMGWFRATFRPAVAVPLTVPAWVADMLVAGPTDHQRDV
jgi:multidrug efflux pump subunit AcrB